MCGDQVWSGVVPRDVLSRRQGSFESYPPGLRALSYYSLQKIGQSKQLHREKLPEAFPARVSAPPSTSAALPLA